LVTTDELGAVGDEESPPHAVTLSASATVHVIAAAFRRVTTGVRVSGHVMEGAASFMRVMISPLGVDGRQSTDCSALSSGHNTGLARFERLPTWRAPNNSARPPSWEYCGFLTFS
jgi:hypothetical protein